MNLRDKIIRLANAKPELREHLLPLLAKESALSQVGVGYQKVKNSVLQVEQEVQDSVELASKALRRYKEAMKREESFGVHPLSDAIIMDLEKGIENLQRVSKRVSRIVGEVTQY